MTTLAELNATDRGGFVAVIGWVFEQAPWVAERAWEQRPFATLERLHAAMTAVVAAASIEEQLALLRAHPELGALRLGDGISETSRREQAAAGLDALGGGELERLRALNAAYREKFGFPFLYAVKGSTHVEILNALERRLTSMRDAEHREALRQVYLIARFRLEGAVKEP